MDYSVFSFRDKDFKKNDNGVYYEGSKTQIKYSSNFFLKESR